MKPEGMVTRHRSGSLDAVVTGLPSDSHTWNLVFMQLFLEGLGHRVVNLGPCVPEDEIVESCCKHRPDLLVVSSVNGHGFHDAGPLIAALRSRWELTGLRVVIGGKLGVADEHGESVDRRLDRLVTSGYDAAFHDEQGLVAFEDWLRALVPETSR